MDKVKSIIGTVQTQLTDQASLIYDQVKSAITTKLDKVMPKKADVTQEPAKEKPADSFDSPPAEPEDPDSFSFSRILDKVWYYIQKFVYPLLCVLMASFIANEMIMYAPIIRFAFFTFFLLVCLSSTGILSSMCAYYLLKLLYGVYVNKMTDRPKIKLLPTVYSMLPLIVDRPLLPIAALFLYPFTYPKTQVDEKALLETMALYQKDLDRSYPAVSNDVMPDKVEKAKEYLKHMHDTPKQTEQKGYIEELNKIVPNPGKFHAPIGQMQIEAAKKAKEMATAVAVAATSMPKKPEAATSMPKKPEAAPVQSITASAQPSVNGKQATSTLPSVIGQPPHAQAVSSSLPPVIGQPPPEQVASVPQTVATPEGITSLQQNPSFVRNMPVSEAPPPPAYTEPPMQSSLENTPRTPQ